MVLLYKSLSFTRIVKSALQDNLSSVVLKFTQWIYEMVASRKGNSIISPKDIILQPRSMRFVY